MNLWQRVQCLDSARLSQVNRIYEESGIPIDIRDHFATWIEVQISDLEPKEFVNELIKQLDNLPFYILPRISSFRNALQTTYTSNPEALKSKIIDCLIEEHRLTQEDEKSINALLSQNQSSPDPHSIAAWNNDNQQHFQNQMGNATELRMEKKLCNSLQIQSKNADAMLSHFCYNCKEFANLIEQDQKMKGALRYHQNNSVNEHFQDPDFANKLLKQMESLHTKIRSIGHSTKALNAQLQSTFMQIISQSNMLLMQHLEQSIKQWKYEQQRAFIGFPVILNIADIQSLAEDVAEIMWITREQLKRLFYVKSSVAMFPEDKNDETTEKMIQEVTLLLKYLFQVTFLIEHHPLPIIRTDTKFYHGVDKKPLTVGSLVAGKISPRMTPPEVVVRIVNEQTAERLLTLGNAGENVPEIGMLTHNVATMECCHPERPHLASVFRHILLKNFVDSRRKGHSGSEMRERVTDKKYWLFCTTSFSIADLTFELWTMSSPLVVTTHVNQDCRAWVALLWDYGLSPIDKPLLEERVHATWPEILELLNLYFYHTIGVKLSPDQCDYLTKKALSCGQQIETLDELSKGRVDGRKFSYWDWFYGCVKLTKDHFKKEFQEGHIIGFVGKNEAEEKLRESPPWTFLLRYSDSICGAISIVCVTNGNEVCSLSPFDSEALGKSSLGDKINDLVQLLYVYPGTPKNKVFGNPATLSNNDGTNRKYERYKSIQQITIISGLSWNPENALSPAPTLGPGSCHSESMETETDMYIDNLLEQSLDNVPQMDEDEVYKIMLSLEADYPKGAI